MSSISSTRSWWRLIKIEEVADENAILLLVTATLGGIVLVCYIWPTVPEPLLNRLSNGAVAVATSRFTKYLLFGTILAVVTGLVGSGLVRTYYNVPLLASKLTADRQQQQQQQQSAGTNLVDLLRPDHTANKLIDACNDLDYAFQSLALVGASPYVMTLKILPEFTWNHIVLRLARRMFYHGWNSLVRSIDFLDRFAQHGWERAMVLYELATRFGRWICNSFLEPILRFCTKSLELIWSVISAVVTAITTTIMRLINGILSAIEAVVRFVVNSCVNPLTTFVSALVTWFTTAVYDLVTHLVQTIQRTIQRLFS